MSDSKLMRLRLRLGWDEEAREIAARRALDERLRGISQKAAAFDQKARNTVIKTGIVHQIGDEVLLNSEYFSGTSGRIIEAVVLVGGTTMDESELASDGVLLMPEHEKELCKRWVLGDTVEQVYKRMLDRTDNAVTGDLPSGTDCMIDVPSKLPY